MSVVWYFFVIKLTSVLARTIVYIIKKKLRNVWHIIFVNKAFLIEPFRFIFKNDIKKHHIFQMSKHHSHSWRISEWKSFG